MACILYIKKPLTIDSQSDFSFCNSNPRHDGLAGVCPSILLGNSLQLQGVAITEHLARNQERQVCQREKEQRDEYRTCITGPLIVEAAQRWADHGNKCWWFEFNFIVKSFNHSIKHSGHR